MPYKKMSDVNPAIKGIEPAVTLAQANIIASWADDITGVDNPWAVAIANFKKAYEVQDGKWVKQEMSVGEETPTVAETAKIIVEVGKRLSAAQLEKLRNAKQVIDEVLSWGDYEELAGSVNDMIRDLSNGFYTLFDPPLPGQNDTRGWQFYVRDTFVAHPTFSNSLVVEARKDGKLYAVPFEMDGNSVNYSPLTDWKEVRTTYEYTEPEEEPEMEMAEASGSVMSISERAEEIIPLHVDVQLIKPGWGNKRDNHYYPREVVEKDARVFEGVKMYESDHGTDKTTKLWVSTVKEIKGFTDDGAPIALVSVHDRSFAERLIALDADGLLDKMECSILAAGTAKKGEVDGKKGHIVESITSADSVDWVTRAGCGGRALALSEKEEATMENTEAVEGAVVQESEPVVISEQEQPEPAPAVSPERVAELVQATNLPDAAKSKLLKEYANESEIEAAIAAEVAYVKEVTGSGKPFAQGGSAEPAQLTEDQKTERFNNIMQEVGLKPV